MKKVLIFIVGIVSVFSVQSQEQIWQQVGEDIKGEEDQGIFGWNLELNGSGDILGVSSSSEVSVRGFFSVYTLNGGSWGEKGGKVYGNDLDGSFGFSLTMNDSGTRVGVGSIFASDKGNYQIFDYDNDDWNQYGNTFVGVSPVEGFGFGGAMNDEGSVFAFGIPGHRVVGDKRGETRIYEDNNDGTFSLLKTVEGENSNDRSGSEMHMSADGNHFIVSSEFARLPSSRTGIPSVRVFEKNLDGTGDWVQKGNTLTSTEVRFGDEVRISDDGNTIAIASRSERVSVFTYDPVDGVWVKLGQSIFHNSGSLSMDMSSDGRIVAIGGRFGYGTAVYEFKEGSWVQLGDFLTHTSWSVALNDAGTKLAVALNNASSTRGDAVRVYELKASTLPECAEPLFVDVISDPCPGFRGEIYIDIHGGIAPYTITFYDISGYIIDQVTVLDNYYYVYAEGLLQVGGPYRARVSDSSKCVDVITPEFVVYPPIDIFVSQTPETCTNSEDAELEVSSIHGGFYSDNIELRKINNGVVSDDVLFSDHFFNGNYKINGLSAGRYVLLVQDLNNAFCPPFQYYVFIPPTLPESVSVDKTEGALSATASYESYQWYDCSTDTAIEGETSSVYEPGFSGDFRLEVFTANDCRAVSECFSYVAPTLSNDLLNVNKDIGLSFFPNPMKGDYVSLSSNYKDLDIKFYNLNGVLQKEILNYSTGEINCSDLGKGVYLVSIYENQILLNTVKLVKD